MLRSYPRTAVLAAVLCLWVVVGAYSPNIPPLLRSQFLAWWTDSLVPDTAAVNTPLSRLKPRSQPSTGLIDMQPR